MKHHATCSIRHTENVTCWEAHGAFEHAQQMMRLDDPVVWTMEDHAPELVAAIRGGKRELCKVSAMNGQPVVSLWLAEFDGQNEFDSSETRIEGTIDLGRKPEGGSP